MTRVLSAITCIALGLTIACAPATEPMPAPDTAADEAAITALANREMAAFAAGDMASLGEIFSADAISMPPNEPAVQGLDALVAWVNGMREQVDLEADYVTSNVTVSGDLAVQHLTGTVTMTPKAGGDPMTESIKCIHVLRRQADGSWRITHDIWNTDAPPPPMGGN